MKQYYIYTNLLSIFFLTLLGSCQATEEFIEHVNSEEGKFLITPPQYSIEMTRGNEAKPQKWSSSNGDMTATVTEEKWGNVTIATRSSITGEEIEWEKKHPDMALYATNIAKEAIYCDVPINPFTHEIYETYNMLKNGTKLGTISNTTSLWDKNLLSSHVSLAVTDLPTEANFYGYYPRPRELQPKPSDYIYERNSIIEVSDARNIGNNWNILSYSFYDNQRDENQSFFDIMCSISEDYNLNSESHYGNIKKKSGDNIQMAFEHVFSLLNITIKKSAEYTNTCHISSLSVSGSQIYSSGELDILTGKTTPKDSGSPIVREFEEQDIKNERPFNKTIIVQPTTDEPTTSDKGRIIVNCTIDGMKYTCDLGDLKLERGNKYNINLLVKPSGLTTMNIWNGATVKVEGESYKGEGQKITVTNAIKKFTIETDGDTYSKVISNGVEISPNTDGSYPIEKDKTYNVVTYPKSNWYQTEKLRIHYDGLWNDKYSIAEQCHEMVWSDLSGHDYDGMLQGFDQSNGFGWTGKGLSFDGENSIVTFPGKINDGDYTIEMYVFIPKKQNSTYPRLIAEGIKYACFCLNGGAGYRVSIYGNDILEHNLVPDVIPTDKMCQLDCIYNSTMHRITVTMTYYDEKEQSIKQISATSNRNALNAESISTASLGKRIADTTRSLIGTYYSFLMYDKVLTDQEIIANFNVNKNRFGTGTSRQ